jgi:hypothetical protein
VKGTRRMFQRKLKEPAQDIAVQSTVLCINTTWVQGTRRMFQRKLKEPAQDITVQPTALCVPYHGGGRRK